MFLLQIRKGCAGGPALTAFHRFQPASDSRDRFGAVQSIQELLVGLGILDNELRLAVYR